MCLIHFHTQKIFQRDQLKLKNVIYWRDQKKLLDTFTLRVKGSAVGWWTSSHFPPPFVLQYNQKAFVEKQEINKKYTMRTDNELNPIPWQ